MSDLGADIARNRELIFGSGKPYLAIGPILCSAASKLALWGDPAAEDFEIRFYPEEIIWYSLDGQELTRSAPVHLVHFCEDTIQLLTRYAITARGLPTAQFKELYQIQLKLLEAKVWAGKLYPEARKEIEENFNKFKRK
ncbi:hypothetical protein SAMN05421823_102557 [Catalinimonas alkaloidigena]|uniref:Uncharacterized protein n=1 Tax=Catalinimonas alkaloidigena TaxID=1075417 RepID=A0A1G9B9L1_9BACT|nr:hypothetical protein [Catalinimonas alkaloidigena]SDK36201.1 hypothetical protein SAMN05421823_102557 [Catalinimonas alkaloidigena]